MARMNVNNEPATKPGSISGRVMRRNSRKPWQPMFCAISSIEGSMLESETTVLSKMKGKSVKFARARHLSGLP